MLFTVAVFALCIAFLDRRLQELLRQGCSLSESDRSGGSSIISPYTLVATTGKLFDAFANTVFMYVMTVSSFVVQT